MHSAQLLEPDETGLVGDRLQVDRCQRRADHLRNGHVPTQLAQQRPSLALKPIAGHSARELAPNLRLLAVKCSGGAGRSPETTPGSSTTCDSSSRDFLPRFFIGNFLLR